MDVQIFFVALLSVSEIIFVPEAWPRLGTIHRFFVPVAIALPYMFLYAGVVSKSFVTPSNLQEELKRYPFDRVLFHPGNECPTCHLLKPAGNTPNYKPWQQNPSLAEPPGLASARSFVPRTIATLTSWQRSLIPKCPATSQRRGSTKNKRQCQQRM